MNKEGDPVCLFSDQFPPRPLYQPLVSFALDVLPHLGRHVVHIEQESAIQIQKGGAIIIVAPHTSHADAIVALKVITEFSLNIAPLVGADYWHPSKRPFVPEIMHYMHFVPLERDSGVPDGMIVANPEDIGKILTNGWNVFMFPEGTRNEDRRFQFEKGAAALSRRYNAPIIPVGLSGFPEILPKGKKLPHIGLTVGMYVDKLIVKEDVPGWNNTKQSDKTSAFTEYLQGQMKVIAQKADFLRENAQGFHLGSSITYHSG